MTVKQLYFNKLPNLLLSLGSVRLATNYTKSLKNDLKNCSIFWKYLPEFCKLCKIIHFYDYVGLLKSIFPSTDLIKEIGKVKNYEN